MAFLLTSVACASVNSDRVAPAFNIALESITGVLFGYSGPIITREIVESIPYASVMVKIGKGTNGLLILESKTDNRFAWVSKDNVYIEIKEGRIQKTSGLSNNLSNMQSAYPRFDELIANPEPVSKYFAYYSYDEPYLLDLKVTVEILEIGLEEVEILGEVKSLLLFEEHISNDEIRWSKKNLFWVDPRDFFVWKSVQHISPKLPSFTIQVTKKPSK